MSIYQDELALQGKGKAAAKSSKVLQPSTSQNQSKKAIEDIYQKKTQLEHILLRPDTYIGTPHHTWTHASCNQMIFTAPIPHKVSACTRGTQTNLSAAC